MSDAPTPTVRYQSLRRRSLWKFFRLMLWVFTRLFYRYRAYEAHRMPARGSLLIVCNHESFFDPVLVGIGAWQRRWCSMARASLFRYPVFGWLIHQFNSIPVEQGASDLKAMRACIDALKAEQALLIFPEGSRTEDGRMNDFAPGTMLLIKRARPMVLPVAVAGSHEAWPRGRTLPRLGGRMGVIYGTSIPADELTAMSAEDAMRLLHDKVAELKVELHRRLWPNDRPDVPAR
jgi:1-acyl-sn-glycerol-3-phosphate acyltransferase